MNGQTKPTINFDAVPQYVKDDLAAATLKAVRAFLAKPGGKEFLDAKIEERRKAEQAAERERERSIT